MAKRQFNNIVQENVAFGAEQYAKSRIKFDSCNDANIHSKAFIAGAKYALRIINDSQRDDDAEMAFQSWLASFVQAHKLLNIDAKMKSIIL